MLEFVRIFVGFISISIAVGIALYGWGRLFQKIVKYPVENWVLTIAIGLAAIIFLGGILNLLRLAYGWALDGLLVIGIILTVKYTKFKLTLPHNKTQWFYIFVLGLVITIIIGFTIKTQLPPKIFNLHDDLEKYFGHPVRMLQTGTLFGSPISPLGTETLGGQAVLHGIVLNHFPIQYINGVDAVFGLLLCFIFTVSVFPLRLIYLPMSLISIMVIFFIYPQYANVSTLYIGSAFVMALILLYSEMDVNKTDNLPPPIIAGLIYAALIAAKPIFVIIPLFQISLFAAALIVFDKNPLRIISWCFRTVGLIFLFLSPWILLHLPHYINWSLEGIPPQTNVIPDEPFSFFSTKTVLYGATYAHYTFVCAAPILAALIIVFLRFKERSKALIGLAAGSLTVFFAYISLMLLGPSISGYEHSLRYTVPILIGGAPIILSLFYLRAYESKSLKFKLSFASAGLLIGLLTIIIFSKSLMVRIHLACQNGSILAFKGLYDDHEYIKDYIQYNEEVFKGDTKLRIEAAQQTIPLGETVVVWVYTNFYLDYKRNNIFDADPGGIASPWAHIFKADYFMIEYRGFAVRPIDRYIELINSPAKREQYNSKMVLVFFSIIGQIQKDADVLYDDGKIIVFKKAP